MILGVALGALGVTLAVGVWVGDGVAVGNGVAVAVASAVAVAITGGFDPCSVICTVVLLNELGWSLFTEITNWPSRPNMIFVRAIPFCVDTV